MKKITLLLMLFIGFSAFAQFPQDFEGTFPPDGWVVYRGTNELGTSSDWTSTSIGAATGAQAAYVQYEAVTVGEFAQDWLVSPSYTVTAPNTILAFYQGQDNTDEYGSVYTIRVSTTSQTDISTFTIVDTQAEADFTQEMNSKTVDLSAYVGQTIYIAFVLENNDGDSWVIDGVDFISDTTPPDCATNVSPIDGGSNVTVGDITFSWEASSTGSVPVLYNIYAGSTPDAVTEFIASTTTTSIDLNLTSFSTTVYWKVVPTNLAGIATGCPVWSFTTQASPGYCLLASQGQYPAGDPITPTSCDGVTENVIVADGYAGEYSLVNVTLGNTYTFSSGTSDFITIANEAGDTSIIAGATPLTWDSNLTGVIRFYSHTDNQCGEESVERVRSLICNESLSTNSFDDARFHAYPNPMKNILNVSYSKDISKIAVFNLLGQEVMTKMISANQSQIDMSKLSSGAYMVKVYADNQTKTIKVVKE